ncbi:MAG TPA: 4Fe-4S binding protein [Meiothermus sp.]|jgi:polyferredoxin|nr:4Fe-4S binding protein [Meiothermus sp.]
MAHERLNRGKQDSEQTDEFKKWLLKLRRPVILGMGASLFTVSLLLARNAMLEGLWFGLLGGILVGPVMHYLLGKVLIPLGFGRVWCGWACWTAALLDQLPYRQSPHHLGPSWARLRYGVFALSLALVLVAWFGFGYREGAVGQSAAYWFMMSALVYWGLGVGMALAFKDNRAFCKYLCPNTVIFKQTARLSLFKVAGEAQACLECPSQACLPMCPMDIRIPDYIQEGKRVLSTECIQCQACVAICPSNTLKLSAGLDLGGEELLQTRDFVVQWHNRWKQRKSKKAGS